MYPRLGFLNSLAQDCEPENKGGDGGDGDDNLPETSGGTQKTDKFLGVTAVALKEVTPVGYIEQSNGTFKKDPLGIGTFMMGRQTIEARRWDAATSSWYYKLTGGHGLTWYKEDQLRKYAKGGMVDYTGPAWVDGTKTHPEAFLSAYQTEQIGALAKAIDPSTVNNATTNSNITFGSVNFNVASMSSAADGKKALEVFVQGANDMMAKKGIGTKLNLNVK